MARIWTHCEITGKKLTPEEIKVRERMDDLLSRRFGVELPDGPVPPGVPDESMADHNLTEEQKQRYREMRNSLRELMDIGLKYYRNPE
jgi:hypothetical protein